MVNLHDLVTISARVNFHAVTMPFLTRHHHHDVHQEQAMARKTRAAAAAKQAQKEIDEGSVGAEEKAAQPEPGQGKVKTTEEEVAEAKLTMEERMAKMKDLRKRMVSVFLSSKTDA